MIVICLEGCHGSGKTQLNNMFERAGFPVLDEAFMDMPSFSLHPQTLIMESIWVSHWVSRILKKDMELKEEAVKMGDDSIHRNAIYIADRSPYSAAFYAPKGHLLEPLIQEQLKDLKKLAGIEIYTVYLKVEGDLLWNRISDRLSREPHRKNYNEDSRKWMQTTVDFYESKIGKLWDFVLENNDISIADLMTLLVQMLSSKSESFRTHYAGFSPIVSNTSTFGGKRVLSPSMGAATQEVEMLA
eukprot:TRINITY_DN624_c4_g1_i1.p1 TRINITY_DN624_c4_g1~~TRINITY_DN624_c4_g1_i1.p1  ORF type:complete len:264 (+),score=76.17 TRINITY_DN624_c4_g1_i1:64-792(+)